ncbi:unnamed protein product, partial [Gulo gulo]
MHSKWEDLCSPWAWKVLMVLVPACLSPGHHPHAEGIQIIQSRGFPGLPCRTLYLMFEEHMLRRPTTWQSLATHLQHKLLSCCQHLKPSVSLAELEGTRDLPLSETSTGWMQQVQMPKEKYSIHMCF